MIFTVSDSDILHWNNDAIRILSIIKKNADVKDFPEECFKCVIKSESGIEYCTLKAYKFGFEVEVYLAAKLREK